MSNITEKNAIITGASFDMERGLSAWIHLDYGGSGQSFGGYCLYMKNDTSKNYAGHFIYRVLKIADVNDWSDLKGKSVRVKSDNSKIISIGHILNDDWFDPTKEFEKL